MDRETTKIVKEFSKKIKKHFEAEKIILFGSRARNDNFKTSDYDFIIISKKFSKIPFLFRASKIYDYWKEKVDIEPICYTPEEFERKSKEFGIIRKALQEGIEV